MSEEQMSIEADAGEDDEAEVVVEPYAFDPEDAASAAERLDEAFAATDQHSGWSGVVDKLRGPGFQLEDLDKETPLDIALGRAAAYRLHLHHVGEAPGCRFGPQHDGGRFAYPTRIAEVPEEEVKLWRALASLVTDSGVLARVNDLLCVRGVDARAHALAAAEAYLKIDNAGVVDEATGGISLSGVAYLVRAWELSLRFQIWAVHAEALRRMYAAAAAELDSERYAPGVVFPLLEVLGKAPRPGQPASARPVEVADVKALVRRAIDRYPESRLLAQLMDLARQLASDDAEREALTQEQAEALFASALKESGFLRMDGLKDAIGFARDRGLTSIAAEATRELQKLSRDSYDMQTIKTSVRIPADFFERQVTPFTESPDWEDGLKYLLSLPCPTGSFQQLVEQEREHANTFIFRRVLGQTQHITQQGMPGWETQTEEDEAASQIAWLAGQQARHHGQVIAVGLEAFAGHYGVPSETELVRFLLSRYPSNEDLCLSLARAVRLYMQGEYEASANLIIGKIEAAARMLLLELDEPVFKVQVGRDRGQYGALFGLLEALGEAGLDEDWVYFLKWLLVDAVGLNARNNLTHGLVLDPGKIPAALVLRAAALMITLTEPENVAAPRSRGELERRLASPTPKPWPTFVGLVDHVLGGAVKVAGTLAGAALGVARLGSRALPPFAKPIRSET